MSTPETPGCLILLNGFPGTGKLTIARALQSMLKDLYIDARLIDNHLTLDVAEAIYPGRGLEQKALHDRLRHVILDELKVLPLPDTLVIMTLCLGHSEEDAAVFAKHVEVARARGIPCHAFTIYCDRETHMLRLQAPNRVQSDKSKLTRPAVLDTMMSNNKILDPTDPPDGHQFDIGVQLQSTSIDTTPLAPHESAARVLDAVMLDSSEEHMNGDAWVQRYL